MGLVFASLKPSKEEVHNFARTQLEFLRKMFSGPEPKVHWSPQLNVLARKFDPQTGETGEPENIGMLLVEPPFDTFDERASVMRLAGAKLNEDNYVPIIASLISEAWISSLALDLNVRPSQAFDRKEVFLIITTAMDNYTVQAQMPFHRNDKEQIVVENMGVLNTEDVFESPLLTQFFMGWGKAGLARVAARRAKKTQEGKN